MGQGHCVAAVDSLNLLVGNLSAAHSERYCVSDEGLTRYVQDFYSYKLSDDGVQDSPLGSHVNHNTAGGLAEGGYLGFAELQYVHMPLPGEKLVVFLSDGAFEEQRGSACATGAGCCDAIPLPVLGCRAPLCDTHKTAFHLGNFRATAVREQDERPGLCE